MLRRLFSLVAPALVFWLGVVACGSDAEARLAQAPSSTPGAAQVVQEAQEAASAPAALTAGTFVKVVSEDPGGSGQYRFNPSELDFKVGETVTFSMTAETDFHTFTVDDLGIDESAEGGETVVFTFTFDRAGAFELICIPHQAFGMVGIITVH